MISKQPKSPLSSLGLVIWGIAALFFLYEFFLRTFIGSIASQIIPDLKLNAETFAILGSAYYIAYAIMQIPVGILVDKFGVKRLMIFATLVCTGATTLFANAHGFTTALISRLLMGFGSSFAFVCLLVIAITWFPRRYFGFFAGASQFIGTMGPLLAAGPFIAFMADFHESWRFALSEIGAFGIVLAILILFIVKNKPRDSKKVLVYLQQTQSFKSLLLKLIKNQQVWCIAAYSASIYISLALLGAIWGTEYLQARGLPQTTAADIISSAWFGYAIGCPILGALSDISKRRRPTLIACSILGLITTTMIVYFPLHNAYWIYAPLFFLLGIAASGQNIGFATISEQVDFTTRATALGLNNGAIMLFGIFIPPSVSYFIYLSTGGHIGNLKPENFLIGLSIMPLLYILALIISCVFIKETYCKPQKDAIILKT